MKLAQDGGDFASFLLGIFIINLLLYTSFYILMKLRYGEKITKQPAVYILLSWVRSYNSVSLMSNISSYSDKLGWCLVLLLEQVYQLGAVPSCITTAQLWVQAVPFLWQSWYLAFFVSNQSFPVIYDTSHIGWWSGRET